MDASLFRYAGITAMVPGRSVYSGYRFPADSITSQITTGLSYRIEFVADVNEFEIATLGNGTIIHIRINGAVVARIHLPLDGAAHVLLVDWGRRSLPRRRQILVECSNGVAFGGVWIPRKQNISAPNWPFGPRMIVVGDSWTDGTGSDLINDHAYVAGQLLGIMDTWVAGIGGTGYLQSSDQGLNIGARIRTDVIEHHPDIVVFCYGSGDSDFPPARIAKAAKSDWNEVKVALPATRIIVEGPWPAVGANAGAAHIYAAIDRALQAAARSDHLPYVSPVQGHWIVGSGYVGHANGTGNSDSLIGPDGIHPSQAGHLYVGRLEASAWRPLLSAFFRQ